MALFNQNYQAVLLNTNDTFTGNCVSSTTIHQLTCLSSGIVNITAIGGGNFSWTATTSQILDVMVGYCKVNSGSFVGFKTQHSQNNISPYYK